MRFLLDQDVYELTRRFLCQLDHDVVRAAELGVSRADDSDLLARAAQENRLLVTRDKDYGALVFVENLGGGVIFLRITPATVQAVHRQPEVLLQTHSQDDLARAFVTVEPGRCRFRKLP